MSEKITTLHPQSDATIDVYPNIVSDNIPSDAVTTDKIKDASVTTDKLADASVTGDKIKNDTITFSKLADESVTTDKLASGAVTATQIANDTIEYSNIGDNQIYGDKIRGIVIDPSDEYFNVISQDGYYLGNLGASKDRWMAIYAHKIDVDDSATFVDVAVGHDITVDGDVKINSRDDIVMSEAEGDTLALSSELTADVNALTAKIDANSALIDTKLDITSDEAFKKALLKNFFMNKYDSQQYLCYSNFTLLREYQDLLDYGYCKNFIGTFMDCVLRSAPTIIYLADIPYDSMCYFMFHGCKDFNNLHDRTLMLGNGGGDCKYTFTVVYFMQKISVAEGKSFKPTSAPYMFASSSYITTITGIDFSDCIMLDGAFHNCTSLAELNVIGIKVSFDLETTALEHDALVVVLNNLSSVTATQTLTMGETKLALLSDEEKAIATDKGWTLA